MNKTCKVCNQSKAEEHFYWCNSRKIYRQNQCKECVKSKSTQTAKNVAKKLKEIIKEAKSVPCMDCKESHPSFVMDFDHRDPSDKVGSISQMVFKGNIKKVIDEMKKCDIVCANCHRERTFGRKL